MVDEYTGPRRWPWVLLALLVLLLAIVFGGHWVWSRGAARRLNAEVALIKASGEPIEPRDFVVSGVGEADNAVIDLRKAARGLNVASDAWKNYEKLSPDLPLTDKEIAALTAVVAENRVPFNDVDNAMTKKGVDWRIALKSPALSILLPDLSEQRQLAQLIRNRALVEHKQGDDVAALRDLQRIEFIASAVGEQPVLVSHLVACGIRALVTDSVERMAPDLKIGATQGAASQEQVMQLIAALLNDQLPRQGLRRGLMGERMIELDTARCIADGTISLSSIGMAVRGPPPAATAALGFVARPIALDDGLLMVRHTSEVMKAIEPSPDLPAFKKIAPPIPAVVMKNRVRHVLAAMLMPAFDGAVQTTFRAMTDRRMTAIALAIRAYRLDHNGALPARLEDLVPAYLPAVPLDALASNAAIKYLPRESNPIIYSVGSNGTDDGGSEAPSPPRPGTQVYSKWSTKDAVTHLTPQTRPAPEAETEALSGVDAESLAPSTQPATTQAVP